MGVSGDKLVGLWIEGQKYFPSLHTVDVETSETVIARLTKSWLDRYFAGLRPDICELPLAPVGSAFRQKVWEHLCLIPYGQTVTYGELSRRVAADLKVTKMSAQAIGGAVGHNPISIIIPCHRVIGADGSLTGYAGGLELKRKLLVHEGLRVENLHISGKKCKNST